MDIDKQEQDILLQILSTHLMKMVSTDRLNNFGLITKLHDRIVANVNLQDSI